MNEVITASNQDNLPERISRIEAEIAVADTPVHIRNIIGLVEAALSYAKVIGENVDKLKILRFKAEARLGEILHGTTRATGGKPYQKAEKSTGDKCVPVATLKEMGVDKRTSARAQKIAELPEEVKQAVYEGKVKPQHALKPPAPKVPVLDQDDREEAETEGVAEQMEELRANLEATIKDNESMAKIFEADNKLAAAMKENAMLRSEVSMLTSRIAGLQNERNEAVRQAKSWKAKYEKAAKEKA